VVDGVVEAGAVDAGVEAGEGVAGGVGFDALPPLLSRGGPSLLLVSIPTGTSSAFIVVFATSVPAGSHDPLPIQGVSALAVVLCSAPLTVNNPSELPVRSPSYTVPESSAMGTGEALYADAS